MPGQRPSRSLAPTRNLRAILPMARALNAKSLGFEVIYDKSYPPGTTDYGPIVRAIQATSPDMVFAGCLPAGYAWV